MLAGLALGPLAGCSAAQVPAASSATTLSVVTSTNVYADIAKAVGGDRIAVQAIIDDPTRNPHEYQADARIQLALSRSDVVVENGGGYDGFVDTMVAAAGKPSIRTVNASKLSGMDQNPSVFNEHVWYDLKTMAATADELSRVFGELDPSGAPQFTRNAATFRDGLTALQQREDQLRARIGGKSVAITEPVPLYLLQAVGLRNLTPPEFSAAVEAGRDMSASVLQRALDLIGSRSVSLLAYNVQTAGPTTDRLVAAATAAGVPSVALTETLPAGESYLSWMAKNLDAISAAIP